MDAQPRVDRVGVVATSPRTGVEDREEVTRAAVVVGLAAIALIHLMDLPETIEDAPSLAVAFTGLIVASLVVAEFLRRRGSTLRWLFAGGLAAATLLGFVLSRTIGIPGLTTDDIGNWGEPLGLASILVEGIVVWLAALQLVSRMTR